MDKKVEIITKNTIMSMGSTKKWNKKIRGYPRSWLSPRFSADFGRGFYGGINVCFVVVNSRTKAERSLDFHSERGMNKEVFDANTTRSGFKAPNRFATFLLTDGRTE
jgi:hypothetical protein